MLKNITHLQTYKKMNTNITTINPVSVQLDRVGIEEVSENLIELFKNGEIDFYQYIISVENAYEIQLDHLQHLNSYNQTIIKLNYLTF